MKAQVSLVPKIGGIGSRHPDKPYILHYIPIPIGQLCSMCTSVDGCIGDVEMKILRNSMNIIGY